MSKSVKPLLTSTMPRQDAAIVEIATEKRKGLFPDKEAMSKRSNSHQARMGDSILKADDADGLMYPYQPEHAPTAISFGSYFKVDRPKADDQIIGGEEWGDRVVELMYPKRA